MIVVTWTVEDGSACPLEQEYELDDWEEEQYLKMEKEIDRKMYIDDLIHQEFQDNISFNVDAVNIEED